MPVLKNSLSLLLTSSSYYYYKSLPKIKSTNALTLAANPYRAPIRYTLAPCAAPVAYKRRQQQQQQLVGFGRRGGGGGERKLCFSTGMGFETPPSQPEKQSEKLLTLPTILTIGRVAAVPLLVATFYVDSWWGTTSTTSIFIVAAITDWLDGYIARKMRLGSVFGAFLDPVADKLMVAATLILLCTRPFEVPLYGQVPWVLTVPAIAIIGREITMSAVREWAASQNGKLSEAVAVNNLGKWKTATQMTALIILLATRDSSLAQSGTLVGSGVVLLYVSAWLSVWSLFVYTRKIWKVLLK